MNKFVVGTLVAISGGLLAACSTTPSANRTSATIDTRCRRTFHLAPPLKSPGSSVPATAVADFIRHGSIAAPSLPIANPVAEGFPATGWTQAHTDGTGTKFASSGSSLILAKSAQGDWQVYRGSVCS